jgi:hypothetical protein
MAAIGLLGTDPDSELAEARDAFESGDLEQAGEAATRAATARDGAGDAGRVRVLIAGGTILLLDALFLGLLFGRKHRRRSRQAAPLS